MPTAKGQAGRLEVALTMSSTTKTITSLTRATQGVATSAAHGLLAGAIGVLEIADGMVEADGQAVRLYGVTTDNFTCQGFDNRAYTTWGTTGLLRPVLTWGLLAEALSWEESGGDSKTIDDTRLLDTFDRNLAIGTSAMSLAVTLRAQTYDSDVASFIRGLALSAMSAVFRLTQSDGSVRVCNGVPSVPTFSLQQGGSGSGGFSVTPRGQILNGKA